jgi:hypothetical protein
VTTSPCVLLECACVAVCRGRNEAADAADRERFLQELEEDAEMRARVALFKDSTALAAAAAAAPSGMAEGDDSDDEDGDLPQVSAAAGSIGAVHWGCALGLCIGAVHWGCALGLCCAAGGLLACLLELHTYHLWVRGVRISC